MRAPLSRGSRAPTARSLGAARASLELRWSAAQAPLVGDDESGMTMTMRMHALVSGIGSWMDRAPPAGMLGDNDSILSQKKMQLENLIAQIEAARAFLEKLATMRPGCARASLDSEAAGCDKQRLHATACQDGRPHQACLVVSITSWRRRPHVRCIANVATAPLSWC